MAAITIQDYSNATIKVTIGSVEYIIKKQYITLSVSGDYLSIQYHKYESSNPRYQMDLLYSDVTSPISASVGILRNTVATYLENFGAGGGGGGGGGAGTDAIMDLGDRLLGNEVMNFGNRT